MTFAEISPDAKKSLPWIVASLISELPHLIAWSRAVGIIVSAEFGQEALDGQVAGGDRIYADHVVFVHARLDGGVDLGGEVRVV